MSELPVPEKANAGMSVEEMKMFVRDRFEDFVNKKQSKWLFGVGGSNSESGQ